MVVFEVVELVLPPFPLLPDWFSRTAVPGTSSVIGSSPAVARAGSASPSATPSRTAERLPTLLSIYPPLLGKAETANVIPAVRAAKTFFLSDRQSELF